MEGKQKRQIPTFGEWEYLESWQLGLIPSYFWEVDDELFNVSAVAYEPADFHGPDTPKGKKLQEVVKGSVRPMAVDEDLYKIPPELLCQKRKRKPWMRRMLRNLLSGCLSFNGVR